VSRGFTLLELLVSMTLLGLILALLFGGLRTGSRVWEAGDRRADDLARIETVHGFLRGQVSALYPLGESPLAGDTPLATVAGERERLRFVGLLPSHFNVGGFQTIEVGAVARDGKLDLGLAWWPYVPGEPAPEEPDEDSTAVLLEDVAGVAFAYFGATEEGVERAWTEDWLDQPEPPELVRLRVAFPEGDRRYWPELIIRPQIDQALPADVPGLEELSE
jgi:general secretion pathway protein J